MSIDFSTSITLWPSDARKRQDIYFQPGLTWTQQGTQGVALLFLENDPNASSNDKRDFQELVKGLVLWVWAAAGKSSTTPVSLAEIQDVYDQFAGVPLSTEFPGTALSYDQLLSFLNAHYRFVIQERTEDMEGTVFPMFPSLKLQVGAGSTISFSGDDNPLNDVNIERLRTFFAQLQVHFEADATTKKIDASSITEFLFVGYARLLIRNGLQAIIDYLEDGNATSTIDVLLNERLPSTDYDNIAQIASRFLLNGFNLPEDVLLDWNDPKADEEGIYASTGQQYPFTTSLVATSPENIAYQVTLSQSNADTVTTDFISFSADAQQLVYSIPTAATNHPFLALANALNTLDSRSATEIKALLPSAQPTLIPYYRSENLHFALRNRVKWDQGNNIVSYLLPLPTALLNHLEQHTPNPIVDLRVWIDNKPTQNIDIPNDNFTWATRIDLNLIRIPNPDGDGFLKETYEVGSSREQDKDLLESILNNTTASDPIELDFLYISEENGTTEPTLSSVPGTQDEILLLRTNLSTETSNNPSLEFSAHLTEKRDFIKLLWQALDINTGGFYLHIPHGNEDFDTTVFGSGNSGIVPLLIQFTNPSDPIYDFNNYAVFIQQLKLANNQTQDIDVEKDLVLARSNESIPVLTVPPGFLGFQIDDCPEASVETTSQSNNVAEELKILYQLLGWCVANNTKFKKSNPGLPIGPTELPSETDQPSNKWLYERLVPVFSLLTDPPSDSAPGLPPANQDPYLGVGTATGNNQATLTVETWWQDLYGNQLLASKVDTSFPVRYTDALIGINQWPSVSEHYTFALSPEGQRTLQLTFSFDPTPYSLATHGAAQNPTESRNNRIQSDRTTLEKVYYQLIQQDVRFKISTSINNHGDSWQPEVVKGPILEFIQAIYRYLNDSLSNRSPAVPQPYIEAIDASGLAIRKDFIFPVSVEMELSRQIELVSDDLKETGSIKPEYQNVLHAPAILSPKFEAPSSSDTGLNLRPFAQKFQNAFPEIRLAVSDNRRDRNRSGPTQQPLYAVKLGTNQGVTYDIQENQPTYYAIPPLTNVLLSGTVSIDDYLLWKGAEPSLANAYTPETEDKQFNAIDINVLARSFLVAVETFLSPATLIPAYLLFPEKIDSILRQKSVLAKALSDDVLPVLKKHESINKRSQKFANAKNAIKQELLVDLVNGYDIETIVQFNVDVNVGSAVSNDDFPTGLEPRIIGKAKINSTNTIGESANNNTTSLKQPDFKLSPGKLSLRQGTSDFTYLFDTKTPELFANLELDLQFIPTEIEYEIEQPQGIADRQSSSFLSFVLPDGLEQSMGASPVPIPLREYPSPPSLILQRAEADPTSLTNLADVRQWRYTIIYEHLDISQDSIDCILQLNVPPIDNLPTRDGKISPSAALFGALVNFGEIYPLIASDLQKLRNESLSRDDETLIKTAILAFEHLVRDIAQKWTSWTTDIKTYEPADRDLHFVISEPAPDNINSNQSGPITLAERQGHVTVLKTVNSKIGGPLIKPTLAMPGYREKPYTLDLFTPDRRDEFNTAQGNALITMIKLDGGYQVQVFNWDGERVIHQVSGEFSPEPSLIQELDTALEQKQTNDKAYEDSITVLTPKILSALGYIQERDRPATAEQTLEFRFQLDPEDLTFFGDSSIPDRQFMVENLDVIEHQNAWASVWLSRNQHLITDGNGPVATAPAFIFQTPAVRFNTMVTPFITNDEPWDIATLNSTDNTPQTRTLENHLIELIKVLFPTFDGNQYAVRLSCRYAFSIVTGKGLNEDLVTTLPILLGLQITPDTLQGNTYAISLRNEIHIWLSENKPSIEMAALLFTVDLFSQVQKDNQADNNETITSSLPTLRITQLMLRFKDIEEADRQELFTNTIASAGRRPIG